MRAWPLLRMLALVALASPSLMAQVSPADQVQIGPPALRRAEPPTASASAEELEKRGDDLRADKAYLDALDYYRAALKRKPNDAVLLNKSGIAEIGLLRWKEARKSFERAIKANRNYPEAYNNLGVIRYLDKKYDKAITQYEKAIKLRSDAASYFSNLGAAYFAKKEFEKADVAYRQALQLDPDIFERVSRSGVAAQLSSPEDRARFDYVIAKLYAQIGNMDRSLEYLRRAMEEGYKGIDDVYKDAEFAAVRKDPRFTELMAARPPAIPQ
ncbi:MAG: tetratricopeptide repeat protein [Acidobacteriia bacterium]|nr:tetratricopeptide repeat protein [Terriglobia bacterium]